MVFYKRSCFSARSVLIWSQVRPTRLWEALAFFQTSPSKRAVKDTGNNVYSYGSWRNTPTFVVPCLSQNVHPSVPKTLTWLLSSGILMIEHWYLACIILVTSPFYWYHAVTLTFYLLQGQFVAGRGSQFFEFACFFFSITTERHGFPNRTGSGSSSFNVAIYELTVST